MNAIAAPEWARLSVRGVGLSVRRSGRGERVLFLHGAGGAAVWFPFFQALVERYELIVPEHPGFGRSDDPGWLRSIPDLAMFYLDALEALDLGPVHLIGNSLGGWIAAELAVRNCSRLQSLTLIAPAGIRVKGVPPGDNFIWSPEEQVRNLFHDPAMADRMLAIVPSPEEMAILLKNRFTVTKLGWQPRWFDPDLEKWLHRVSVPAHVVWGDDDRLLPTAYAELWRTRLPDARVTLIEAAGHLPHVERPEPTGHAVLEFLKGVGP